MSAARSLCVAALLAADPGSLQAEPVASVIRPAGRLAGAHRFALFVGVKDGGPGTRLLRHAERDARRMHQIFTRLGGLAQADARLLVDVEAGAVRAALGELGKSAQVARDGGESTELFVYFSGHSNDSALRLKGSLFPLDELRQLLLDAPADVRIGLLDACRSGAITRAKGVRAAPAFDVQRAREASGAHGLVLIASSASDEESQESDDLDGSFFTHALASGLLGDADGNGDGRVTLAEAWAHAYGRTVGFSAGSTAGTQHPRFLYDLGGAGDVVLTSLFSTPGGLVFGVAQEGVYVVLDASRRAIAEVAKPRGETRRLALGPGRYIVKKRHGDALLVREVKVGDSLIEISDATLDRRPLSDDPQKGGTPTRWSSTLTGGGQYFFDAGARKGLFPPAFLLGLDLAARGDLGYGLGWGLDVAVGGSESRLALSNTVPSAVRLSEVSGGGSLWREFEVSDFTFGLGGRVALLWMSRAFPFDPGVPKQSFFTVTPGLVALARWRLGARVTLLGRGRLNYLFYSVDRKQSLGYTDLSAGVEVGFGD